jgi:hypothetical protein
MAKSAGGKTIKTANPMLTKNGKQRLGPLNLKQLTDMLEKSSRPKDKAKIQKRVKLLEARVK